MISPDAQQGATPRWGPGAGDWSVAALNRMAEGLTVHDAGGRLLFANARVTRVLGGLEITALTDANGDVLRFEDERGAVLPLRALPPFCADLEGGECERTCLMRREGGHHRWIRIRSQRMHDATWGTVMVTLWTDVTRRRARRALAMQREALLSAHRTAAREGILAFSSRGRVLHWNNALLELLRIPESLLEPRAVKPVLLLLESQAREPRQLRMLTRGMARPRDRMAEQIVALRDGRTLGITRAPIREPRGTVHGQAWFFRDVTLELHSAARDRLIELEHAALASSEASRSRYELLARLGHLLGSRELAEAVPDCLRCIASHFGDAAVLDFVDAAGPGVQRRVEVSRSALEPLVPGLEALASSESGAECIRWAVQRASRARLHGLEPAELASKSSLWVFGAPSQLAVLEQMGVRRLMGVPVRTRAQIRGFITVLGGGEPTPFSADDERLLEEIAVRLGFALERDEALEKVRRAVAAREEFIAAASHELRTPLSTLLLTLQGAMRQIAGASDLLPPWMRTRLQSAVRQTNQLRDLVDRMMDVTRLSSGRIRLTFEKVDLPVLVAELTEEVAELVAEAGCTLEARAEPLSCVTDRTRLRQALSGLLENACKYGRGSPICLEVRRVSDCVEISVTDGGPGIPTEHHDRVFGRFERAAPEGIRGHGLGLYILREVVEGLGGTVTLENARVRGATFRIRLPPEGPGAHPSRSMRAQTTSE